MAAEYMSLAEFQNRNFIVAGIYLLVVVAFSLYSLYLNYKQANVHKTQKEQIELMQKQLDVLQSIEHRLKTR